jgi:hypothetical protein
VSEQGDGAVSEHDGRVSDDGSPRVFWTGVVLGGAVLGWGVFGLLAEAGDGVTGIALAPWLLWFAGGLVVHDGVFAPLAHLVGSGIKRIRPAVLRTPLQSGIAATVLVLLVTFPYLRGYGVETQPGNESIQTLAYGPGVVALVMLIWVAALGLGVWQARRARGS